ncbi:hypothetical protein IGI04_034904 [Brassica rapa subsp. trilocularis]|uniref:Uncharacterized protein n=1 Tax=Brassica rapa subsp. trilocularis TaxID=1813537 RepID=A0ABQ7LA28_BRACM|nr:hypothetical protein IGI04_034904 [Brassica rapa subsp. trilocularis]
MPLAISKFLLLSFDPSCISQEPPPICFSPRFLLHHGDACPRRTVFFVIFRYEEKAQLRIRRRLGQRKAHPFNIGQFGWKYMKEKFIRISCKTKDN